MSRCRDVEMSRCRDVEMSRCRDVENFGPERGQTYRRIMKTVAGRKESGGKGLNSISSLKHPFL